MKEKALIKDKVGYVEFHGGIKDWQERERGMVAFNKPENKYGEQIKIILISPAGSEGLSLANVRQAHIMEPYWNEVRITQMIGRAIRLCSHKDLPVDQRHVDVYRYKSVRSKGTKFTTDQHIEDLARSKDGLIQSFLDAVKQAAIDCVLNKNHNMITQEYKCFQFDEPSLFDEFVGPAYKEDIYDDMKLDNGLNSTRSVTMKIKVMEIKAVTMLSKPNDPVEYSEPESYWLYPDSGVIYDHKLHYPIGKIAYDNDNIPLKLNKETYIIDKLIPIPLIKN
jgi:hypothetical protein